MKGRDQFAFATAQEIVFGRGAARDAAARIGELGQSVLVVHGATTARAGWLVQDLELQGLRVATFSCPKEPDVALIEEGLATARAADAAAVVSLGGGAVIDTGKAIAALALAGRPVIDHLEVVGRGLPLEAPPLPFVALPTTAGTGAEVTRNAVVGVPEAGRKVSLRDQSMLPRLAIVDPALTDGLPKPVTLASGLDAVTQVIEPYVSRKANRLTDALCRDAIPLGLAALVRLMEADDPDARDDLAWTSLCGGLALANAGLGAVHGLAGVIGGRVPGAAHGAICGTLLPHVLAANAAAADPGGNAARRITEVRGWIAGTLGGSEAAAPQTLASWSRQSGLPGLSALGLQPDQEQNVAAAAGASSSMKGNPVELPAKTLARVLERAR